jgi:uncharacterized membrane protein YadS
VRLFGLALSALQWLVFISLLVLLFISLLVFSPFSALYSIASNAPWVRVDPEQRWRRSKGLGSCGGSAVAATASWDFVWSGRTSGVDTGGTLGAQADE